MRPQIKTIIRPCVCDWQEAEMDPDQHPSFHNQIQEKEPQDVEASIQNEPDDPSQAAGHTAVRPSSQPAPGTPPDPSDGIGRSGPIALYWNRGTDGHVPDPEDHDETPKRTQRILEVLQVFRRRARALGTAALGLWLAIHFKFVPAQSNFGGTGRPVGASSSDAHARDSAMHYRRSARRHTRHGQAAHLRRLSHLKATLITSGTGSAAAHTSGSAVAHRYLIKIDARPIHPIASDGHFRIVQLIYQ
jgi:hypothetical protein